MNAATSYYDLWADISCIFVNQVAASYRTDITAEWMASLRQSPTPISGEDKHQHFIKKTISMLTNFATECKTKDYYLTSSTRSKERKCQ